MTHTSGASNPDAVQWLRGRFALGLLAALIALLAAAWSALPVAAATRSGVLLTGWPGPGTTGVPAGTALSLRVGSLYTTRDGQVLDSLDVRGGSIIIRNDNVTVRRTRVVTDPLAKSPIGIRIYDGHHGIVIQDCEIDMQMVPGSVGIGYAGYTVQRCDIHGAERGIQIGSTVTATDNWVHDLYTGGVSHTEDVAVFGSLTPVQSVIRHNTLSNPFSQTATVFIKTDQGPVDGVTIDQNLLDGGCYAIYSVIGYWDRTTAPTNVVITNNVFTRSYVYGPTTFNGTVLFTGNTYLDNLPVR